MRVESSRDVYASAESAVVFLARAENGRKSSGRGAEEIFPDSQKSLFARWNGFELPTFMLVPLLISGEFSAKEFFSCLLAFRLFINANESINEPEYETELFLEKTHKNIHIFTSPQREIFHK